MTGIAPMLSLRGAQRRSNPALDCFVAALLAMTRCVSSQPEFALADDGAARGPAPPDQREAGEPAAEHQQRHGFGDLGEEANRIAGSVSVTRHIEADDLAVVVDAVGGGGG